MNTIQETIQPGAMQTSLRAGIIDIGSNSIRLVVYESESGGSYRVLTESREAARLSALVTPEGIMPSPAIHSVVPVLRQFVEVCEAYGVAQIRAVATAAIRNASNSEQIIEILNRETGLEIELLPGEMEGHYGFIGVVNKIDIREGFIIDIGGGSTEITLFQERRRVSSFSFPFGAVNMNVRFGGGGTWSEDRIKELENFILGEARKHPWMSAHPGLDLVGLGGTIRGLGKMDQRRRNYSLPHIHNYAMQGEDVDYFYHSLPGMDNNRRKRVPGLSKSRIDIIVPGMIILRTLFRHMKASRYIVSATGLREGLFFELLHPEQAVHENVLEFELRALLSAVPKPRLRHLKQTETFAGILYEALGEGGENEWNRKLLRVAAWTYQIGTEVGYIDYEEHTQYLLTKRPLAGLTHREIILTALIAGIAAKGKWRKSATAQVYRDILLPKDEERTRRLGYVLQMAAALDASETQAVTDLNVRRRGDRLELELVCRTEAFMELRDLKNASRDFEKEWNVKVELKIKSSH
ncbi:Ppx/GppA phosphatase family protein [Saccharibacillus sp. CPCC 101409]|uniref:Ppx/GppA phosphatase family protein n=1 Tax=Saccharibacillus sp. CPCC 101409 TaxID=3058041 RepID=UPI0026737D99|nr:Ppx/GppA phosphatase family protein [Saccharibacillus sp. CPCC 101409]MDO3413185.1 Ppx/GppA phosphatase family protein [Saccharibacillus sp. CPCC 101409]